MGFWGIEVKPGKPQPHHSDNVDGKLHVTQATLGLGKSTEKSILQCSVGDKNPIFLCSLLPNMNESCPLNLEFSEDDLVAFSVIGSRSIHLSGYFVADCCGDHLRDEFDSDSYGEDIEESETESSEFDTEDEYDDDFIEDDNDMFPPSPVPNSGVVIEEIVDDEKPANSNGQSKRLKKKDKSSNSERQIVVKSSASVPVLESEDEDGFPISTSHKSNGPQVEAEKETDTRANEETEKKKAKDKNDHDASKKRKVKTADKDDQPERKKKKKQKEKGEKGEKGKDNQAASGENQQESKNHNITQKDIDNDTSSVPSENQPEKKKKKNKKKKAQESEGQKREDQTAPAVGVKNGSAPSSEPMQTSAKSTVRTFPNGLVIEEVAMGKPDGKRASPGKQVSVHYIGKLKKNGKIFDSNVGRAPFKFRLGIGQVIKGWDVGVNGMRVGDKRRLTIPPAMGYGAKGAGGQIPPNSWLVFDVELVNAR
ncbi:hypothetical protein Q3G72_010051 [Acer saccharum]|nr:hypothetical protein Q3G72_010051 [Acer saccharum]